MNPTVFARVSAENHDHVHRLSKAQTAHLKKGLEASTLAIPESFFQGKTYDQLLEERLKEDYKALG